ncbi:MULTISPECIES: GtrA family protein [Paenibacillus]|uniref:GtrA family protein n=1 Tax=Paenibacillus TaxID=44249 RepID=UPI000A3EE7DE|nr:MULTISPECIES: GtrA family protein [Paenibacillus]
MNKPFIKYLLSGGFNTLVTYLMYLLLLNIMNYNMAYSISYVAGILLSYYLNSVFVFQEKISLRKFIKYPVVYIVQYLINLVLLNILIEYAGLSTKIVPIITIVITIPITFLLTKFIIKGK